MPKTSTQKAARKLNNVFVTRAIAVDPDGARLGFSLGGEDSPPFPRNANTDICCDCYLPACTKDSDLREVAGYQSKIDYCPIMGQVSDGLSMKQAGTVTHYCLKHGHGPKKALFMVEQWVERNRLND